MIYLLFARNDRPTHPDQITLSAAQLTEVYRLVDEFATDTKRRHPSLEVRLKFFQMLLASIGIDGTVTTPEQLRASMARFAST